MLDMLKRWWKFALVITLALSLTSCARKAATQNANYGFGYCDGSLGSFDVYVVPLSSGQYQLSVIPVNVNPGDVVSITLTNTAFTGYRPVISETTVNPNQEIDGNITDSDLTAYNILTITPYAAGPYYSQNPATDVICNLPLPGYNTASSGNVGTPGQTYAQ